MSIAYDYAREATPPVSAAKPRLLLIDGQHVPSASGRTFKTLNPATEQVIATVAEGNEADVDRAVAAARRAFEGPWRTMRASERGQILLRLVDLMKKHADEIAALESLDAGKPISGVLRQDLPAAIDTLTYYAGWADKISGEVVSTRDDALTYTVREPVGVVAAIVPWNFPLMIGMWKLAPALACGCTIVMKPAELTSLSALRIGELALEAGLPPGVLNIVTGPGRGGRRRPRQSSRRRQGDVHGIAGRRPRHPARRGRQFQTRLARTRRQVRQRDLRRRRYRGSDQGGGFRDLLQRRAGLLGGFARARA